MNSFVPSKMNILVVDDAIENLILLQTILESESLGNVHLAQSAVEAFDYLGLTKSKKKTKIDLVIMDLMMPEISGLEAIIEIRKNKELQDTPILVISAKTETKDLVEAFEAGATDYLTKPINELELLARIRAVLRLKAETDHRKAHERALEQITKELEEKNNSLNQILKNISADLESAGRMQRSLLPDENLVLPGLNFAWYYEPCSRIGGDLINFVTLNENITAFFILDVSGHGIQSAIMAISIHRILSAWKEHNSILKNRNGSLRKPEEVIKDLNLEFTSKTETHQYFTIIYGLFDKSSGQLSFVRAGHPPAIVQTSDNKIIFYDQGNLPVGLVEDATYESHNIVLKKRDRLWLYSDGLTESRKDDSKEFFGQEKLTSSIQHNFNIPLKKALKNVINDYKAWTDKAPPGDDLTLMAIESNN